MCDAIVAHKIGDFIVQENGIVRRDCDGVLIGRLDELQHRKILFSVNEYDIDGEISEKGVYLHFGDTRVKVAEDKNGFRSFISQMEKINKEISENY